jgi:choline dehydrogenase
MLSGIGDGDDLKRLGIRALVHLPGVGKNLHDHIGIRQLHVSKIPTFTDRLSRMEMAPFMVLQAIFFGSGPASQFPLIGGAFIKTDPGLDIPDIQFHFCAGNLMTPLRLPFRRPSMDTTRPDGFSILVCQIRPRSRGSVTLLSTNPLDTPRIVPNYLSDEFDRMVIRKGFKIARLVTAQPDLSRYSHGEFWPGPSVSTDLEIDRVIRTNGTTIHHPVGTCKMGIDETAVVDGELRVRGVEGLRVVDASVMPGIIGGNTNAPVIMIAEKAADMIGSF